ncbi:hypothetical protein QJS10_CPB17g01637 [Acorus calamus]|uniref:non-specific serine/threonine protein kinase n=1 Tax=Acorus calamus TaxID=4465 RepID=A0AAV9CXL2_ACOCL|nr:hypothetical protein QJS10_CPB17g01637 [Acorus calamus]
MGNCCRKPSKCANASSSLFLDGTSKHIKKPKNSTSSSLKAVVNESSLLPSKIDLTSASTLKSFTFNDLKTAAKNFRSETYLGEGGFGCVFKGWIDKNTFAPTKPGTGIVVAIKKLKPESFQGHKEWLAEITYLSHLHHENLVRLIGYCLESGNRLLVYEYMPRGSLENHLFKRGVQTISWSTRINIAIGVARGLAFLHGYEMQIIYRDLKASNVLLDSDLNAKLSDFGLARDGPTGDDTHVSTRVVGTQGYAAPEYISTGHLTVKSDVYSFGVVLLELITGQQVVDEEGAPEKTLVDWARPFLSNKRRMLRIMDTRLEGQYSRKGAQAVASLVLQCLNADPKNRPNMRDVLSTLEELSASTKEKRDTQQQPKQGHHPSL